MTLTPFYIYSILSEKHAQNPLFIMIYYIYIYMYVHFRPTLLCTIVRILIKNNRVSSNIVHYYIAFRLLYLNYNLWKLLVAYNIFELT